jgi:endonuclease YncB( thermonuclease family)
MLKHLILLAAIWAAPAAAETFRGAIHMVDGDTLRLDDGPNLRLIGIDAVESDQECRTEQGLDFACGAWVTQVVREQYNGVKATCRAKERDRYDRPLVTCRVQGADLGATLVRSGLARTYRETTTYAAEEKEAVLMARGLWSMQMEDPATHRLTRTQGRHAPDPACTIKGNISKSGRIYHRPQDASYAKTGINETKGERWFCTEAEARAAGWRPARNR